MALEEAKRASQLRDSHKSVYNIPYLLRVATISEGDECACTLGEAFGIAARLERLMEVAVEANPTLRVTMDWDAGQLMQYVFSLHSPQHSKDCEFAQHFAFSEEPSKPHGHFFDFSPSKTDSELACAISSAATEPLSSAGGALFRFHVFYELPAKYRSQSTLESAPILSMHVMFNFHHIIIDAEGMQLLLAQLGRLARQQEVPSPDPLADNAYFKYCQWVNDGKLWIEDRDNVVHWTKHLAGWQPSELTVHMPRMTMPTDGVWPKGVPFISASKKIRSVVSPSGAATIKRFCSLHDLTPSGFFLSCLYLALWRVGRAKSPSPPPMDRLVDMCVGSAMSNRGDDPTLQSVVCLLADVYPFRVQFVPASVTVVTLFLRVRDLLMEHLQHARTTLGGIVVAMTTESSGGISLKTQRTPLENPLFGAAFLYEDEHFCSTQKDLPICDQGKKVNLELLSLPDFGSIFEIQLLIQELPAAVTDGGFPFSLTWEYAAALYDADTMRHLAQEFADVVGVVLACPNATLATLPSSVNADKVVVVPFV